MRRLWSFFKRFLRHRRQLIGGFLCIPLAQLGDVEITIVIGGALDRLRAGSDTQFLAGIFWINEEKQGYFLVTDTGKKEFALQSTAAMSNWIMVVMGIAMVSFTVGLELEFLPKESVALFGGALILIGSLFLLLSRKTKPRLSSEAKTLLKELNRR